MSDMASMIVIIMQTIINDIDIDSKYMDFFDDFEVIDSYVESFDIDHPIRKAWSSLNCDIFVSRGDLYSILEKMQSFIQIIQHTSQSKLCYT